METPIYSQFRKIENEHWWFQGMHALCRNILKRYIYTRTSSNQDRLLDVGCGTGFWAKDLCSLGKVIALDNATEALSICRKQGLHNLIQANAQNLPIMDNSCDVITALGLIEHLDDDNKFLRELERVLKPGGFALLLTSANMFLWGQHDNLVHHKRRYTQSSFKKSIRNARLDVIKITYVNTFLLLPILLMRLAERLRFNPVSKSAISQDLLIPPKPLNQLLFLVLRLEAWLIKWLQMPFGVGLLALVRKRDYSEKKDI